jgi:hypothetical protein
MPKEGCRKYKHLDEPLEIEPREWGPLLVLQSENRDGADGPLRRTSVTHVDIGLTVNREAGDLISPPQHVLAGRS